MLPEPLRQAAGPAPARVPRRVLPPRVRHRRLRLRRHEFQLQPSRPRRRTGRDRQYSYAFRPALLQGDRLHHRSGRAVPQRRRHRERRVPTLPGLLGPPVHGESQQGVRDPHLAHGPRRAVRRRRQHLLLHQEANVAGRVGLLPPGLVLPGDDADVHALGGLPRGRSGDGRRRVHAGPRRDMRRRRRRGLVRAGRGIGPPRQTEGGGSRRR
mmetsp:Transcript_19784/g.44690  ORF Transcript_19784/g.44690 Transcript_19784/m.44690 type:complete len:211 (+) Transcript_19784:2377-3009(+)